MTQPEGVICDGSAYNEFLQVLHDMMLKRNLIYTGITRGKRPVVLVGQIRALAIAVKGQQLEHKWSKLEERLME